MNDEAICLRNDLIRRADSCDVLAEEHTRYGNTDDARVCAERASIYRHAAELVRVYLKTNGAPRAAEPAR